MSQWFNQMDRKIKNTYKDIFNDKKIKNKYTMRTK